MARSLGLDIVGPLALYFLCRNAGMPQVWALVVAGSLPALGVVVDWLRWHTLEVLGVFVLGAVTLMIVLALLTENAKVVLLQDAVLTGVSGAVFLVSLRWHRPLIFYIIQAFWGGRHSVDGAGMEADYDHSKQARSYWRTVNIVWGVTTLLQAAGMALVVQNAPTATALTINRTASWLIIGALSAWALWLQARLQSNEPAQGVLGLKLLDSEEDPAQPDASRSQRRRRRSDA